MKPLTLADRVYLARYFEYDGPIMMGALYGRPYQNIIKLIEDMRKSGNYDLYRNLSESEFEKILQCAEVKHGAIEEHDHQ